MDFCITQYGAVADGKTLSTKSFQKAVDDCALHGGGNVIIPSGKYVLGTVFLKDNIKIYFEDGAILYGSEDLNDFCPDEKRGYKFYQDISHSCYHCSMFVAEGCKNLSVEGNGTIDMRSVWECENKRGNAHRGAKIFAFRECCNVVFKNLTLLNATDIALYLAGCENVIVEKLTLKVHIDGISPDCCKNVSISNCDLLCGDDGIVPKSSYTLNRKEICENIFVTNCNISSRCSAIKFGTESNGGLKNFRVKNCSISNTRISGIALEIADGGIMDGVLIENIKMKNVGTPIFIVLTDRGRGPEGTKMGEVRNITIRNVVSDGDFLPYKMIESSYEVFIEQDLIQPADTIPCSITGQHGYPLKNIRLENIDITIPGGGTEEDRNIIVPENSKAYPESWMYGKVLPAKGIYFRYLEGLYLRNISVRTLRPDARENMIFENVKDLTYLD